MNDMYQLNQTADYIKGKIGNITINTAIILGSGLGALADEAKDAIVIPYSEIPNFPVTTVKGHKGQLVIGKIGDKYVLIMQGRFHYYEGYDLQTITMLIRVMKLLGIENLIITNAAGGINASFNTGDLMLIDDHINLTGLNPLIGENLDEFGERFPDMTNAYDNNLKETAVKAANNLNIPLQRGVYVYQTGPSFETPAEIRALRTLGGDAVGMSTVPEVVTARHCGIKVLGLSLITNQAAGVTEHTIDHKHVMETAQQSSPKFINLINEILKNIH